MDDIVLTILPCGHGDTILLEWYDHGKASIGIVDCNRENRAPENIINIIKSKGFRHINFLIISHPHYDHYSGFIKLLSYIRENSISIGSFLQTFSPVSFKLAVSLDDYCDYLHSKVVEYKSELISLFECIRSLYNEGFIKEILTLNATSMIYLNDNYYLKLLSPSTREIDLFLKREILVSKKYYKKEESYGNNPLSNYLSTLIGIFVTENNKLRAMLTADSECITFERICLDFNFHLTDTDLDMLNIYQVPHHGSEKNHCNVFMDKIKFKNVHTFISSGKNIWGHPANNVVKYFKSNSKELSVTNVNVFNFFRDDAIIIWSDEESNAFINDDGLAIKYLLNKEECKLL